MNRFRAQLPLCFSNKEYSCERLMEGIVVKHLEEQLAELELKYRTEKYFSFNHIMELYLYQFYQKDSDFKLADEPMNLWYLELGNKLIEDGELEKAYDVYQKAEQWNPVDLDAKFAKIELEKKQGKLSEVLNHTLSLYPYLCSRATMARFYRNLGFYYVETYKPDLAEALYEYSNLFFQTENAENELEYLESALKRQRTKYNVDELQKMISEAQIPVAAASNTLGLLYEVGKSEEKKGHLKEAAECYLMVYDLTQDEEVKERIRRITS